MVVQQLSKSAATEATFDGSSQIDPIPTANPFGILTECSTIDLENHNLFLSPNSCDIGDIHMASQINIGVKQTQANTTQQQISMPRFTNQKRASISNVTSRELQTDWVKVSLKDFTDMVDKHLKENPQPNMKASTTDIQAMSSKHIDIIKQGTSIENFTKETTSPPGLLAAGFRIGSKIVHEFLRTTSIIDGINRIYMHKHYPQIIATANRYGLYCGKRAKYQKLLTVCIEVRHQLTQRVAAQGKNLSNYIDISTSLALFKLLVHLIAPNIISNTASLQAVIQEHPAKLPTTSTHLWNNTTLMHLLKSDIGKLIIPYSTTYLESFTTGITLLGLCELDKLPTQKNPPLLSALQLQTNM